MKNVLLTIGIFLLLCCQKQERMAVETRNQVKLDTFYFYDFDSVTSRGRFFIKIYQLYQKEKDTIIRYDTVYAKWGNPTWDTLIIYRENNRNEWIRPLRIEALSEHFVAVLLGCGSPCFGTEIFPFNSKIEHQYYFGNQLIGKDYICYIEDGVFIIKNLQNHKQDTLNCCQGWRIINERGVVFLSSYFDIFECNLDSITIGRKENGRMKKRTKKLNLR